MKHILILIIVLGVSTSLSLAGGRSWTVLGEASGEFKQRPVDRSGNRPDAPIRVSFKVPGPGVLRVTINQKPYYSGIASETGCVDMTRKGDSSMLAYGLYWSTDPVSPQAGQALTTCMAGQVNQTQNAVVEFRAPVNYGFNTQLGCAVRIKVEFSSGLPKAGESFVPTSSGANKNQKAGLPALLNKKSSFRVGAIVNGQKIGAAAVPWVFNTDGTFEAPGLWKGTWTLLPDKTIKAKMAYNGVTDNLIIRFTDSGFTAYKDGAAYRWGSLIP